MFGGVSLWLHKCAVSWGFWTDQEEWEEDDVGRDVVEEGEEEREGEEEVERGGQKFLVRSHEEYFSISHISPSLSYS